ncbi:hypothetical protein NLU13_5768 [Sarocladium strictum]|uniref:DUF3824 domain-containing protein n=1 Tax=Sarocladium strictum TaxID=5046 RepID=A0AA39GHW4_SARSR|nr:hypothetical protein NLU13_5768 [Sarocladium strictum]
MGEVYRERERERYRDYRDGDESDDERYRSTTVTRYKVPRSGGYERTTERVVDVDESGRSHYSSNPRGSGDLLDAGGRDRGYPPERPRSAFEPSAYDRDRYYDRDDRSRVSAYGVSGYQDRDRGDRRGRDDEVRVEKRTEERFDDAHGHEVERIRKETEYYAPQEPAPAPIVIRQRAEPQKIIVQEAPPPAPLVLTRAARDREYEGERQLARRERDRDDEYYSRYERREVGPYRGDPREDDRAYAMARYDRDRERDRDRDRDDEYYVHRRRVVRRESSSSSEGHKRELAGGALAGAGITALLSSRRDADGDLPANRGKKVIAGAALGALGTEALKRARSAYGERRGDRDRSPDDHSRLKKGLGLAAVALAAAGAAQYYKANKVDKEESRRGRSRSRRHSHYDDHDRSLSRGYYSRTPSRSPTPPRSKSRRRSLSRAATAVLGTAAAAGVIKKLRDRSKSKARSASRGSGKSRSRSRSKSRLRRAAEIGGVAATAGIASKMWKNHREKKAEEKERERSRSRGYHSSADESDYYRGRRGGGGRGLVEYGDAPLGPNHGYEDEAAERRRRRRLRDRSYSSSASEPEKRSKSRLRNMAAAGAAAIGVKELMKDKDDDRRSREREEREQERIRRRSRRRSHGRLYDDDPREDDYFNERDRRPAESPPMASGGAYYHPPYPGTPGPAPPGAPYAQFPNASQPNVNDPQAYYPQDYMGYPPPAPAPGPPPPGPPGPPGPPPPGPPPPGANIPPAYVSDAAHGGSRNGDDNEALNQSRSVDSNALLRPEPSSASKSVTFIPLSPKSSQTMQRHLRSQIEVTESEVGSEEEETAPKEEERRAASVARPRIHRRRSSDPTADRPLVIRQRRGHAVSASESDEDVEDLPDRFDDDGRPIDGRRHSDSSRWTSRRGEFQRKPRRPGDWDVRGAWQVAGTDGIQVDRLARSFTEALEGRRSWMGVIGEALGGGLLGQPEERRSLRDEEEGRRRRR